MHLRPTSAPALLLAAGLLLTASPARAACDRDYSGAELARFLSTADAAFASLDDVSFRQATAQARKIVPCLSEPLTSSEASAFHRAEALQAFLDRDHPRAVQHFRAMLRASPGMKLALDLAPDGHPLRTDFEIAEGLPPVATRPVPTPEGALVWVDGVEATDAPASLPFVLQLRDNAGALSVSTVVDTGASLPDTGVQLELEDSSQRSASARRERLRMPLIATAVVAAATSASLYGMSASRNAEFWDPSTADAELDGLRQQTNTMAYASLGAGIIAVGTGTAAVLSFTW